VRLLLTALRWDLVMQYRYGFWVAGLVVTLAWSVIFWPLSRAYLDLWLPVVLFADIAVVGLMFIAGVLFFERGQGAIDALVVTPMPTALWLLSKVISLTFLATAVASGLVVLLYGWRVPWGALLIAISLSAALNTLVGFLVAAKFNSVSNFLAFFGLVSIPISLPVLSYFGIFDHALFWIIPQQSSIVLLDQAFRSERTASFYVAIGVILIWIVIGFRLSVLVFHRYVGSRRGA